MKPRFLGLISLCVLLLGCSIYQASADTTSLCSFELEAMSKNLYDFVHSLDVDPNPNPGPGPHPIPFNVTLSTDNQYFLAFSGRFLNDFGEYDVCQNLTTSHYLTMLYSFTLQSTNLSGVTGFCAPVACSADDANANTEAVFDLFYQGMGLPFANYSANLSAVSFYDPNGPAPGSEAATVIAIMIYCLIGLSVLAGTGLGLYWDWKDKNKKGFEERLLRGNETSQLNNITQSELSSANSNNTFANLAVSPARPKREFRGIFKFLDCFDARKNFDRLTKVKYTDTYDFNLEIFNGIRVFMMLYVVFGHSFLFGTSYIDNDLDLTAFANSWWMLILNAALFSVDVFFYMSGFLFAYIGLGKLKKMRVSILSYVGLCIHRFLRFWPAYALAILFFWRILPLMGSGPVWFEMTQYTSLCDATVWQNFLLLDDFLVQSANYCYGWGWYLSNDFQMFMITPFFLWLYIRKRRIGKLSMVLLMVISWIIAIVIGFDLHLKASPPRAGGVSTGPGFSEYYVKPYIRLPPYFIGVLAALLYKEYKEKIGSSYKIGSWLEKSPYAKNIVWFIGLIIILLLTFLPRQVQVYGDSYWPDWFHVCFRAFQKSLYVVGLTMMITPILLGDKTLFKRFTSHPILVPLARLSFSAYLVHLFWVYKNYFEMPFSYHFTFGNGVLNTLSNATIAFLTGLLYSILIEVPMANIETTYVSGAKRKPRQPRVEAPRPEVEERRARTDETTVQE